MDACLDEVFCISILLPFFWIHMLMQFFEFIYCILFDVLYWMCFANSYIEEVVGIHVLMQFVFLDYCICVLEFIYWISFLISHIETFFEFIHSRSYIAEVLRIPILKKFVGFICWIWLHSYIEDIFWIHKLYKFFLNSIYCRSFANFIYCRSFFWASLYCISFPSSLYWSRFWYAIYWRSSGNFLLWISLFIINWKVIWTHPLTSCLNS